MTSPTDIARGFFVARRVTMARRKTVPMTPRSRRAVSRRPLFSMRFKRSRISAAVISAIGRLASGFAGSSNSHLFFANVEGAARSASCLDRNSPATRPKVLRAAVSESIRSSFF
jgi:hypothetical protein